ncbi:uncharacterized protein LOC121738292 [Aricia agestis]|uniref:uncharacterized protein LOC121738292 n=1 Tax=Aricia agestis TaxID=91739 RepID=UPI001C202EC3|nr:uncharacterized protein LOC121738292 [Aricia agestis]
MSEKHLQTGDALPGYNGKLRVFAMRFCPYAERTVLVLNAKNIPYDIVFINLDNKPEWIFTYSPKGTVPALEYEQGKGIFDSTIVNVYLDEKYPETPLQSTDPLRRAQDKMIVELFAGAQSAYYTAAFNSQALQPSMVENYHKALDLLQKELQSRGTKFLHGDEPGLVDYTIWPFLERFEALPLLGKPEFAIESPKYDALIAYMSAMKNVPSVKQYCLSPDTHAKFTESRVKGDPNYNMLDTSAVCCMRPRKKKEFEIMISSTVGFAMHILASSYRIVGPVAQLVEYLVPFRSMAKAVAGTLNYNSKHLRTGDPLPPFNGKPRLFNTRMCPFAHRIVLALNAKKIDYEIVNIDLMDKPEWFSKKSPFGKVPVFEVEENVIVTESLIIAQYLDDAYPQHQLLPKDPVMKAQDKVIAEVSIAIFSLFFKIVKFPDSITEDTVKGYHKALDYIQAELEKRGTVFLDGNTPGYADYMIWPWFERVLPGVAMDSRLKIDPVKYKLLLDYVKRMYEDPIVKDYLVPDDIIIKYVKGVQSGNPNYDLLMN